jgi:CelD/BcsL family acetyltransferase involved in cellulose biosynthesis
LRDFSGAVKIASFRKVTEVDNLVKDAEQVAQKSYQRGLGVGFVNSPEVRERLRLKAQKGWLRAYVLYVADRPCAYWICDLNQGILGGNHVGFDPGLAKYSPGMYLMMKVIEGFCDARDNEVVEVDFALGDAEYKQELGNREWQEAPVYIFAPSLKGVELSLIRYLTAGIDQSLKKLLGRTTLLRRIKKNWRTHVTRKSDQGEGTATV